MTIHLPEIVGKGYGQYWKFKGRYRVVKGSRASKKSKTTSLWIIASMMKYPGANTLVVRKVYRTLKDSCFSDLKWAIHRLGVDKLWEVKESPLEMTYVSTGQKILFRGLDDPLKVTSISVDTGYLCWAWIEEAYEVTKESDFDMLDESIRGAIPKETGLFKQITITFNPWNDRHWIKHRFFDDLIGTDPSGRPLYKERKTPMTPDGRILAMTTTYQCNEWLDSADLQLFETMKTHNPRRYKVAGLGQWGIIEGLVYENWREQEFTLDEIRQRFHLESAFGLDFGYAQDPTALFCGFIDTQNKKIFVWDELYKPGLTNQQIYQEILSMGYAKEKIIGDSAEPKSISELQGYGLRITGATKGPDSINNGIQYIQNFEIIVHPRCVNFITEISNYQWAKDRFGNTIAKPEDSFNHLMDAMRYALEGRYLRVRAKAGIGRI